MENGNTIFNFEQNVYAMGIIYLFKSYLIFDSSLILLGFNNIKSKMSIKHQNQFISPFSLLLFTAKNDVRRKSGLAEFFRDLWK